ncbi:alpha/beta hydrolase [Muriicola marianensis]|uniref:Esterase n=1 Tax=Muriicola marianensis TaxID=1324801 RepID=A0ABQ1QQJ2_9FLAO|nr:esterase [Muriicola marianensis]GGD37699.1 esterase [Muriicola marianensis]
MEAEKHTVSYTSVNSFESLNRLNPETKYIWFAFHGMGHLSKYFLKYFEGLDPKLHYLITPQAPSKYYLNGQFKHVGASWLTKEDTAREMENILSYLDAIMDNISLPVNAERIVFGYSQGVSIALRWVVKRKVRCDHLILYAGGIPEEILPSEVTHLREKTRIKIIVGDNDEYITPERWEKEKEKIEALFQGKAEIEVFDGKHEIKKEIINTLP